MWNVISYALVVNCDASGGNVELEAADATDFVVDLFGGGLSGTANLNHPVVLATFLYGGPPVRGDFDIVDANGSTMDGQFLVRAAPEGYCRPQGFAFVD